MKARRATTARRAGSSDERERAIAGRARRLARRAPGRRERGGQRRAAGRRPVAGRRRPTSAGASPPGPPRGRRSRSRCIAWSLLQLWYASPLPFTLQRLRPQRHRDALAASRLRAVPRLPRVSVRQALAARPHSGCRTGRSRSPAAFCGAYLFLFYRELADPPGPADAARLRHRGRRHGAAARGDAARGRAADRDHRQR